MQRPFQPIRRTSLLALCLMFVAVLLAPVNAGAQGTTAAAPMKQCRHRYAGKAKRRAERQCIRKARQKQRARAVPTAPIGPPAAGSATPVASTQPPVPDPGSETAPPSSPSPPAPPPVLELGAPHASVVAGSTIDIPLPQPLISVTSIESVTGREPGVGATLAAGGIEIQAYPGATPVTRTWTISGTGCTASECHRQFAIHLRVAVEESPAPTVQVLANGPVSGPAGFGQQVLTPSCSYLEVDFDDGSMYGLNPGEPKEAFDLRSPSTLLVGPHHVSLNCLTSRASAPIWTASGFEVTVTGAATPLGLESTMVLAGGELIFTSGPSLASVQCPTLPGLSVSELALQLNTAEGSVLVTRQVTMPDARATEGLSLPSDVTAGKYSAFDKCVYGNAAGEYATYEFAAAKQDVTIN